MTSSDIDEQLQLVREAALFVSQQPNLKGYCGVVSMLVMNLYGGCLMTAKIKGIQHYWNRLSDGRQVDITSCQFDGDGWTPLAKGRKVPDRQIPDLSDLVHLMIYQQMLEYIRKGADAATHH